MPIIDGFPCVITLRTNSQTDEHLLIVHEKVGSRTPEREADKLCVKTPSLCPFIENEVEFLALWPDFERWREREQDEKVVPVSLPVSLREKKTLGEIKLRIRSR